MRKKISRWTKQITAFLLATTFLLSGEVLTVFANIQSHVKGVVIEDMGTTDGYDIKLSWEMMVPSKDVDTVAVGNYQTDEHWPDGYEIKYRNTTEFQNTFEMLEDVAFSKPGTATEQINQYQFLFSTPHNSQLDASLFSFQVTPYHEHRVEAPDPNNPGQTMLVPRRSNYTGKQMEVLYMTDLKVTAYGKGDDLVVEWDNPTYFGNHIFDGYRIYFERGGSSVEVFNNQVDAYMDSLEFFVNADRPMAGESRARYTIENVNFEPGQVYAVKVEPFLLKGASVALVREDIKKEDRYVNVGGASSLFLALADPLSHQYRTNDAVVAFNLDIEEAGKEYIELKWDKLSTLFENITRTEIRLAKSPDLFFKDDQLLVTFTGKYANEIVRYKTEKPKNKTYYMVSVYLDDGFGTRIDSIIGVYDPRQADITPVSPELEAKVTDTSDFYTKELDVFWTRFLRKPVNEAEEAVAINDFFEDLDVYYDLYVTDVQNVLLEGFAGPKPPPIFTNYYGETEISPSLTMPTSKKPAYKYHVKEYVTFDTVNGYQYEKFTTNKTYYLKMVAKKRIVIGSKEIERVSRPAYLTIHIDAKGDISIPPVIGSPPLHVKEEKVNSIVVEWKDSWFEVYDKQTKSWHSYVAIRKVGSAFELVYGQENFLPDDMVVDFARRANEDSVKDAFVKAFMEAGASESEALQWANSMTIRQMQVNMPQDIDPYPTDAKYQMKYFVYNGLEDIKKALDENDAAYETGWQDINVTLKETMTYELSGVEPNTTYVILLRAYREEEDKHRLVGGANYVLGTTLPIDVPIDIDPVVPAFYGISTTDTSAKVAWNRISGLAYDLVYDVVERDTGDTAHFTLDWETVKKDALIKKGKDIGLTGEKQLEQEYYVYDVEGLFPETDYYFWIRSRTEESEKRSAWSSSVMLRTKDLLAPTPPDGLGLASHDNVNLYNNDNNTAYKVKDAKDMVIEWLKDSKDHTVDKTGSIVSNGGAGDPANPTHLPLNERPETYMVRYENLQPYTTYFVRAKTILTVTMEDNKAVRYYHYKIQLSRDIDFVDYVEIIVPDGLPEEKDTYFIRKESDFSDVVVITTGPTDEEYDGGITAEQVPLPKEDFEIVYEPIDESLIFRFRTDKIDAAGNKDNQVDQRFISKLVQSKTYNYTVDVTRFENKRIRSRKLILPYSIYKAFEERKITLTIVADNATFTIMPGSLEVSEVLGLPDFGKSSTIEVVINELNSTKHPALANSRYVSKPQSIQMQVKTGNKVLPIGKTAKPMTTALRLEDRTAMMDGQSHVYYKNENLASWQMVSSTYNKEKATLTFSQPQMGDIAILSKKAPTTTGALPSDTMYVVNSKMHIADMNTIVSAAPVSATQLNKMMAAILLRKAEVNINSPLTEEETNLLKKASLFTVGSSVTREEGISKLIGVYELGTQSKISGYGDVAGSKMMDISSVSPAYQVPMLKAERIGFFAGTHIRPKDAMTVGEMFIVVSYIVEDMAY